jgi:AraC-like DNA-binding protein
MEYYFVTVQDTGESIIIHNDRVVNITAGDVVLLDSTKPVTFISRAQDSARWLGVQVPRQKLASHLGFEPQGGVCGPRQAQASRLLCQLALDPISDAEPAFASTDQFMHLVVYDLLGALFAPPAPLGSRHNDKLFMRVCGIIKDRFADPDISPREVAAEAGISLRYLQKLFTVRGSTCGHHICSARLDHAARLIERRALMKTGQPLSDIAYACGFRDYTHFARGFRRRFGTAPGAVGACATCGDNSRARPMRPGGMPKSRQLPPMPNTCHRTSSRASDIGMNRSHQTFRLRGSRKKPRTFTTSCTPWIIRSMPICSLDRTPRPKR